MYYIYIKQFSINQKISNLYVLLKLRIKDSHTGEGGGGGGGGLFKLQLFMSRGLNDMQRSCEK